MEHDLLEHILDGSMKPRDLPLSLLKNITGNFSEKRKIGEGGFGIVYRSIKGSNMEYQEDTFTLRLESEYCVSSTSAMAA